MGGDEELGEEGDNWLSLSAEGPSGSYERGISKEKSDFCGCHWAPVSWGSATSNGEYKLALKGEHGLGYAYADVRQCVRVQRDVSFRTLARSTIHFNHEPEP